MKRAFTLIELLVVVGIIAILAAIALPNFLEAKVRSTVAKTAAGMAVLRGAVEMYSVDHGRLPRNTWQDAPFFDATWMELPRFMTTPVSYVTAEKLVDPFTGGQFNSHRFFYRNYTYLENRTLLHLWSAQPPGFDANHTAVVTKPVIDRLAQETGAYTFMSLGPDYFTPDAEFDTFWRVYDPTNGTLSSGNMFFSQKEGPVSRYLGVGEAYPPL